MTKANNLPNIERTSTGLREALFDEIDAIRRGESNPTRANAVAKLAGSVVETVRLEIDAEKHARSMSSGAQIASSKGPQPLALGN